MDAELASLRKQIADQKDLGEIAVKQIAEYNEIKKVLDASPSWIDELERIALNMPSSDKVILWSPTFTVMANGEGMISTKVYGISSEVIAEFEEMLRKDDQYRVSTAGVSKTDQWPEYPWETTAKITFKNRGWALLEDGRSAAANLKPAADPKNKDQATVEQANKEQAAAQPNSTGTAPATESPTDKPPTGVEPANETQESDKPQDAPTPTTPDKPKGNEVVGSE